MCENNVTVLGEQDRSYNIVIKQSSAPLQNLPDCKSSFPHDCDDTTNIDTMYEIENPTIEEVMIKEEVGESEDTCEMDRMWISESTEIEEVEIKEDPICGDNDFEDGPLECLLEGAVSLRDKLKQEPDVNCSTTSYETINDYPNIEAEQNIEKFYLYVDSSECKYNALEDVSERYKMEDEKVIVEYEEENVEVNKDSIFKCRMCDNEFDSANTLKTHSSFECQVLKSTLSRLNKTYFDQHSHKCEVCEKIFSQSSKLKRHKKTHANERRHKCRICKKSFKQSRQLEKHEKFHLDERRYECEICQKTFPKLCTLKTHKKTHTNERPYKCEICNLGFKQLYSLNAHKKIHSNDRPYKCQMCDAAFKQSSALNTHKIIHYNERRYKCTLCVKSFNEAVHLYRHKKTHLKERPHKCEICNKTFCQLGYLKKHKMSHLEERPHSAEYAKKPSSIPVL